MHVAASPNRVWRRALKSIVFGGTLDNVLQPDVDLRIARPLTHGQVRGEGAGEIRLACGSHSAGMVPVERAGLYGAGRETTVDGWKSIETFIHPRFTPDRYQVLRPGPGLRLSARPSSRPASGS